MSSFIRCLALVAVAMLVTGCSTPTKYEQWLLSAESGEAGIAWRKSRLVYWDDHFSDRIERVWRAKMNKMGSIPASSIVIVEFKVHMDGHVSSVRLMENTVDSAHWRHAQACIDSIWEAAPFKPWTLQMRRVIGSDARDIRFTFKLQP